VDINNTPRGKRRSDPHKGPGETFTLDEMGEMLLEAMGQLPRSKPEMPGSPTTTRATEATGHP